MPYVHSPSGNFCVIEPQHSILSIFNLVELLFDAGAHPNVKHTLTNQTVSQHNAANIFKSK